MKSDDQSDDQKILCFDPWSGDESDVTLLRDQMRTTRAAASCSICFEAITIGSRVRARVERLDGRVMTFKFCPTCCAAMVLRYNATSQDDEMVIENRYELGRKNAEAQRARPTGTGEETGR